MENELLKEEISKRDEFRMVLEEDKKDLHFDERRIKLLKAHICRQRIHITNLTETLKLTRRF